MFDFEALERLEQGLQINEDLSVNGKSVVSNAATTVARTDYLIELSSRLHQRSTTARAKGLHG